MCWAAGAASKADPVRKVEFILVKATQGGKEKLQASKKT